MPRARGSFRGLRVVCIACALLFVPELLHAADRRSQPLVRDRLWAWAHDAGVYNGHWGFTNASRMTPVEGATYLGVPNLIFIRYEGRPSPPFDQYAIPFRSMRKVYWSITGASGATSAAERDEVLRLASANPNITGVFMDDFFLMAAEDVAAPQWLARNNPSFPVIVGLQMSRARALTRLELRQSDWRTGDYRTKGIAVDVSSDGDNWREVSRTELPNQPGASRTVSLGAGEIRGLRVRVLGTHDRGADSAQSCGLLGLRLWDADGEVPLSDVRLEASSSFPGHEPAALLPVAKGGAPPAPAALSVQDLQAIRSRLELPDRRLDLGVTLYTYQLTPRIRSHLDLCDVISLWTWKSEDLAELETSLKRLEAIAPGKRILLGCYLYDFGNNRPMPLDRMKAQCAAGLRWLKEGRIEGMIFLGTNVCDLNLETVEWTRAWIAGVGGEGLTRSREAAKKTRKGP